MTSIEFPADATTASRLCTDPIFGRAGITKQAISKQVSKFQTQGLLPTFRQGRVVYFSRSQYLGLRESEGDVGRAHLRAEHANGVRTDDFESRLGKEPNDPPPSTPVNSATMEAASRTQAAKAEAAEAAAARQKFQLAKELGQYIEKSAVEVQVQRLLVPLRALMIDGAPDLSRQLQGIEDERQRTQIIRAFFRDGLNTFAEKLREPNVDDSDPDDAGGPAGDGQ